MDKADEELRKTLKKLWPLQGVKTINLLVPPKKGILAKNFWLKLKKCQNFRKYWIELHGKPSRRRMTVGKIYAGLLILENYRSYKQSVMNYGGTIRPV